MTFLFCRILGNELPPRDKPNSRLESLRYILNHEILENRDNLWIINHIHDPILLEKTINLLGEYSQNYTVLTFDKNHYQSLKTRNEKICYAININEARNHGLKIGQQTHDFVVSLDGDCFFTPDLWDVVQKNITLDQKLNPRQYYAVITKRLLQSNKNINNLPDEEPMLIFRNDADIYFDPTIPFGQNPKVKLLQKLGFKNGNMTTEQCKIIGYVLHISFSDDAIETQLNTRMDMREKSIEILLRKLDEN